MTGSDSPRQADTPVRAAGRVAGGAFVWPPPATSTVDRRWPYEHEFVAVDAAHRAGLHWLQDVALAVRTERLANSLSRDDLARLAGVSFNAVVDLENGLRWLAGPRDRVQRPRPGRRAGEAPAGDTASPARTVSPMKKVTVTAQPHRAEPTAGGRR